LKKDKIVIGTRGSELALWQTNWVKDRLQKNFPSLIISVEIIKTKGDFISDTALSKIGDKGLFTKEIEQHLLNGNIDLAVHSLKDLPTELPKGLRIGAVSERTDQRDVFISNGYSSIDELPHGASVATGSLRRRSQLLNYRPDLNITDIRGNIKTRLQKLDDSGWDAMILAYAGIHRLSLGYKIRQIVPTDIILPATCQGIMAVEIRENDKEVRDMLKTIDNHNSEIESRAERSFLSRLEGGCQIPVGIYSKAESYSLYMEGFIGSLDGKIAFRERIIGSDSQPESIGRNLANMLLEKGGRQILDEIRNTMSSENANA
jgi:hydroxymethylbilane synthase